MKHRRPALSRWSPTAEQLRRLRDAGDEQALVLADKAMYKGRKVLKRYLKRAAGGVPNAAARLLNWNVFSLDVWGNEEDGYEINNRFSAGLIRLPRNAKDAQIVAALKREGYLNESVTPRQIEVLDDDFDMEIRDRVTGEPLYILEKRRPDLITRGELRRSRRRNVVLRYYRGGNKHRGGS